jgi:hypothetical protein
MINEYAFPNSTCEKTNEHGISQPYSATLNIINCVIIFYFYCGQNTFIRLCYWGLYYYLNCSAFSHNSHSQFNPDKHYTRYYVFHKLFFFLVLMVFLQFHK